MSLGLSSDFKELVRSRTNLVELVSETVSLSPRHGGSDYAGLCPFHDDHNPSFHVYPDRQTWRCWVCNEGGDCFSFLMRLENIDFRTALEQLAQRANLEMPASGRRTSRAGGGKDRLLECLAWAEQEMHFCFLQSPIAQRARDYMASRGFTAESLGKYRVGYHPHDRQWILGRARGRYTPQELLAARLVRESRDGSGYYDDFVDRVMFPIRDERGRVVAFGGRILPDHPRPEAAKYLNSPESAVFSKSKLLYGLDVAKEAVRKSGTAVVVEGYTDCIMAHQAGIGNVVGTLGTSLTESHVGLLRRFARTVVLVYDGDDAGQNAAERAVSKFLVQEVDLRILTLPAGQDPADFFAAGTSPDAFQTLVESAPEAWEHQLLRSIDRHGLDTTDARQRVLEEMLVLVAGAPGLAGSAKEDILLNRLSQRVGTNEQRVRQRLSELRKKPASRPRTFRAEGPQSAAPAPAFRSTGVQEQLESELLQVIFVSPATVDVFSHEVAPEEITNSGLRRLLETCYGLAGQGIAPTFDRVMAEIEDPELKRLAVWTEATAREREVARLLEGDGSQPGGLLAQLLEGLRRHRARRAHEELKGNIARLAAQRGALDPQTKAELLRRASDYHRERVTKRT